MSYLSDYLEQYFDEASYKEFYRDIFSVGSLQEKGVYEKGKYNGILVEVTDEKLNSGKPKVLRHTVTDDLDVLDEVVSRDNFCLMSPISYAGKTRDSSMARELYALTFDLDGLISTKKSPYLGIKELFLQIEHTNDRIPRPTYVVSSGTGLHLYYVFEKPIPLFENVLEQLEVYKRKLTWFLWHDSISTLHDDIQYEPVCQGFRVVGTITKKGDRVRAFKTGSRVTMEYMNSFYPEEYKVTEFAYKSDLTLEQAKEKYPEWYKNRIVEKKKRNTWIFNRRVYDRWLERIKTEFSVGHRYWCVWVLAVTAMKCGISQDELEKDAFGLIESFNKDENPFTKEDILSALEGYDSAWFTYPIEKMAYRSDIPIQKNKRNGRKQEVHLKIARSTLAIMNEDEGKILQGRPDKKEIVKKWQLEHPDGTKYQCTKDTGLSKNTVKKWWNGEPESKVEKKNASEVPTIKLVPKSIISTKSDSDTVNVMIQLPKSTLEKINNMSLDELETMMEVQEDENIIGYACYRIMMVKNNKK